MAELFYLGIIWVVVTFFYGLNKAKPYNLDNQDIQAKLQRMLSISYGVGFIVLAFGASQFFISNAWWTWVIIVGSSMMGFGAFQEARKKYPNAPRGYGEE